MKTKVAFSVAARVLVVGLLAGCATSERGYRVRTTAIRAPTGDYDVTFVIEDLANPDRPLRIRSPHIRVAKGKKGRLSLRSDERDITCTAVVEDAPGGEEARTTISIHRDGKTVWSERQTVRVREQ